MYIYIINNYLDVLNWSDLFCCVTSSSSEIFLFRIPLSLPLDSRPSSKSMEKEFFSGIDKRWMGIRAMNTRDILASACA